MTAASPTSGIWNSMPGWGISANLLPAEILEGRRIRRIRKIVIMALAAVILLAAAGYGFGYWQSSKATTTLEGAQAETAVRIAEQNKFGEVLRLQGSQDQIKSQLATLRAGAIDVSKAMRAIGAARPAGTTISTLTLTLTVASKSGGGAVSGADALDASGRPHIGSVALGGQAKSLTDVAMYTAKLATLPGVSSAFPTSQQANGKAFQFTLQLTLNDQLLVAKPATPATTAAPGGK